MEELRLITIRFSHYNEKARWVLDYYKVPYREEPHMFVLNCFLFVRIRTFPCVLVNMSECAVVYCVQHECAM